MATITTIQSTDAVSDSRAVINTNFSNLNTSKLEAADIASKQDKPAEGAFVNGDKTKLDGIETGADVTDTANVTAAGALMDSECASLADVKALNQSVVSGASPTFSTANFTDATNKRLLTDAQEALVDGSMQDLVDDTTPQLGGNLDLNGNSITGGVDIVFQTGATGGKLKTGTTSGDKYAFTAYDVDGTAHTAVQLITAGNIVENRIYADYVNVADFTDPTKQVTFDPSGATTSTATDLVFSQTANRTITFPDATGTIALTSDLSSYAPIADPTFTGEIGIGAVNVSETELGILEGATLTTTELNYVDGVTSAIQTQLDAKAPTASPTFTGTVTLPTGLTGVIRADSGVVSTDSDVTDIVAAASTSAAGKVELATSAETTTGTDTGRAITPDGLAGSDYGKRIVGIQVFDSATDTATGDGKAFFRVPSALNGYNLVGVAANVYTAGTTGTTDIQIRNVTDSQDMLSTKLTIDSGETDSSTAATAAVINTTYDDVATGDKIAIDVDAVSTTAAQGLYVELIFQLP